MARAKRTDENQKRIVALFRQLGCLVYDTSAVGDGFPDIIIQYTDAKTGFLHTKLVEIKNGKLSPSRRRLTKAQTIFHSIWTCHVVESEEDVFKLLEISCN